MRILLDTDIIIELLKNREAVVTQLRAIGFGSLNISTVTKAELLFGALHKADLAFILKGIASITVQPITPSISEAAVELMKQYVLSNRLALPDALIAATALHHGLPLYTLNKKDFRYIAGLHLYEPA